MKWKLLGASLWAYGALLGASGYAQGQDDLEDRFQRNVVFEDESYFAEDKRNKIEKDGRVGWSVGKQSERPGLLGVSVEAITSNGKPFCTTVNYLGILPGKGINQGTKGPVFRSDCIEDITHGFSNDAYETNLVSLVSLTSAEESEKLTSNFQRANLTIQFAAVPSTDAFPIVVDDGQVFTQYDNRISGQISLSCGETEIVRENVGRSDNGKWPFEEFVQISEGVSVPDFGKKICKEPITVDFRAVGAQVQFLKLGFQAFSPK